MAGPLLIPFYSEKKSENNTTNKKTSTSSTFTYPPKVPPTRVPPIASTRWFPSSSACRSCRPPGPSPTRPRHRCHRSGGSSPRPRTRNPRRGEGLVRITRGRPQTLDQTLASLGQFNKNLWPSDGIDWCGKNMKTWHVYIPWASKPLKYPGFASKTEVRPGKPGFVEKKRFFFQKHGFSLPYLFRFTIWILKTIPFLDVQNGYCKLSSSINSPKIFNVLGAHSNPWKNHGLSRVNHGSVTGKSRVGHYQVFP